MEYYCFTAGRGGRRGSPETTTAMLTPEQMMGIASVSSSWTVPTPASDSHLTAAGSHPQHVYTPLAS